MEVLKFLADQNVAWMAKHLRSLGHDAVSVPEIQKLRLRENPHHAYMWKDSSIRRLAIRENRILLTADRGLHGYCRRVGEPQTFLIRQYRSVLSKIEQIRIVQAHFDRKEFDNWLQLGMPWWTRHLHHGDYPELGDGEWHAITPRSKENSRMIEVIALTDGLGYPRRGHSIAY